MPNLIEELSYSTIRIICTKPNGVYSVGTGFVMSMKFNKEDGTFVPVLVTNKHVIKDSIKVSFILTEMVEGQPSAGCFPFELPLSESAWRKHPDDNVDLCALAIGPILNALKAQGKFAKVSWLPMNIIASDEEIGNMFQLDEVVMIGYPNGILDEVNNQPIFRRGI